MTATSSTWKDRLAGEMPAELAREIDIYETQLTLKRQGKIEDKLFAEARLRRGAYGQRYDNGQRHDGIAERRLGYRTPELTKGPDTLWDAPGMQRIKIPFGGITPQQMEVLADLAEEYSDGICHITTRQDVQLHFVHIEDTPDLMRRLAAVGITSREACGNSVRNVTGCPLAGVCRTQAFDVTPAARACMRFLLGHPDTQDFGRKFKVAFSGCRQEACALTTIHDLGFIASVRDGADGPQRGYEAVVGGGLGPVPYRAKLLEPFVPEAEILPLTQAIARVYARLGEKRNRNRARIKFLVEKLGIDEFRALVRTERMRLAHDPAWTAWLADRDAGAETPPQIEAIPALTPLAGFGSWRASNVYAQRQAGFAAATVKLPLGDITSWQMRELAHLVRRFCGGHARTTVEQNIVLRWVAQDALAALHRELDRLGLAAAGAGSIVDVVSCPGTDTCKLGIASSRGLGGVLGERLAARYQELDAAVQGLHIKVSGCFNSCAQHHIADLGFYGVSRKVDGRTVPHFRLVLGGQWEENAGVYGRTIGVVPSKRVPDFVDALIARYLAERESGEGFRAWIKRIGPQPVKALLDEHAKVPAYAEDPSFYSDWRDPREYSLSDLGVGECAGQVVTRVEFELHAAERRHFEAQLALEQGDVARACEAAFDAMVEAARGLLHSQDGDAPDDVDTVVAGFRERFHDSGLFNETSSGKFAHYLFRRHAEQGSRPAYDADAAARQLEEAQLFIEAAYAVHARIGAGAGQPAVQQAVSA